MLPPSSDTLTHSPHSPRWRLASPAVLWRASLVPPATQIPRAARTLRLGLLSGLREGGGGGVGAAASSRWQMLASQSKMAARAPGRALVCLSSPAPSTQIPRAGRTLRLGLLFATGRAAAAVCRGGGELPVANTRLTVQDGGSHAQPCSGASIGSRLLPVSLSYRHDDNKLPLTLTLTLTLTNPSTNSYPNPGLNPNPDPALTRCLLASSPTWCAWVRVKVRVARVSGRASVGVMVMVMVVVRVRARDRDIYYDTHI